MFDRLYRGEYDIVSRGLKYSVSITILRMDTLSVCTGFICKDFTRIDDIFQNSIFTISSRDEVSLQLINEIDTIGKYENIECFLWSEFISETESSSKKFTKYMSFP